MHPTLAAHAVLLCAAAAVFAQATPADPQQRVAELEARVKELESQNAQLAKENADLKGPGHPGRIAEGMPVSDARLLSGQGAEWRICFHDNSVTSYEIRYAAISDVATEDQHHMKDDLWGIITTFNKNKTIRSVIRAVTVE